MRVIPPRRAQQPDAGSGAVAPQDPRRPPLPPSPAPQAASKQKKWLPANFRTLAPVSDSLSQLDQALAQLARSLPPSVTQANPSFRPAIDTFIKLTTPPGGGTTPPGGGTTPPGGGTSPPPPPHIDSFFDITYRIDTHPPGPRGGGGGGGAPAERTGGFIKVDIRSPDATTQAKNDWDYWIKFRSAQPAAAGTPPAEPGAFIKFGPRGPADARASDYFLKIDNARLAPLPGTDAPQAMDYFLKVDTHEPGAQATRVKLGRVEFKT